MWQEKRDNPSFQIADGGKKARSWQHCKQDLSNPVRSKKPQGKSAAEPSQPFARVYTLVAEPSQRLWNRHFSVTVILLDERERGSAK